MTELFTGESPATLDLLLRRRSTSAKAMGAPGPDAGQLRAILKAAARVPDHGKLFPWRFIVFEGEGREAFGAVLEEALAARSEKVGDSLRRFERNRFLRAPVVVAVVYSPSDAKPIPQWEQQLSVGAVCQTLMLAAISSGFGVNWLTEWCAYDDIVTGKMGLAFHEKVAGFIYIGTSTAEVAERERPELDELITVWTGPISAPANLIERAAE